ncbi:redox-regulated ATPase YchF [Candidatus Dependentiae bacterium]
MAIQAGLVGLPNVGKSTLFNALTKAGIPAQNYPFCTIDPHVAITEVPDERLGKLVKIFNSKKIVPSVVQFVDIAGLVKGAAQGEGLGNQFLGNIMNVDLILHIIRCFTDSKVTHVHNEINPLDDLEIINAELMLKDLESTEKREEKILNSLRTAKNKNLTTLEIKELEKEKELIDKVKKALGSAQIQEVQNIVKKYKDQGIKTIPLLSAKKFLIIANISEDDLQNNEYKNNQHYQTLVEKFGSNKVIPISAKIESELSQLSETEKSEMMSDLNIEGSGLNEIIKKAYQNLGLINFFTCGPQEIHSWSIPQNTNIVQAAGTIHSDMERGFICAEVYDCKDIFELKTEAALKNIGKIRTEGKDYTVHDGDILLIRFNV